MKIRKILAALLPVAAGMVVAQTNVVEEVAWVIGDQPIWKSEIEEQYSNMMYERVDISGDPYCVIPEQLAIEKLYLHQADLDTLEAQDAMVQAEVDAQMNMYVTSLGSREKVEEYFRKSFPDMRAALTEMTRNRYRVRMVQQSITEGVTSTPSDVRRYYDSLSKDSVPYIPLKVAVEIIKIHPVIPRQEIDDVKARLRDYADRVNRGESDFSTLAILYSEDKGSASRGGELGFAGKATFEPEFAAVAFNLNDPKKASKIVETQYGFHIIQLIEKRGDRVNARHILLRPKASQSEIDDAMHRLDSLRTDMVDSLKFTFEQAVMVSNDKDTRNNHGQMVNSNDGTTLFQMSDLPQEIAREVSTMEVGDVSKPFVMIDPKLNREVVSMVKLTNRVEGHKANIADDYQTIKTMYENAERNKLLRKWLEKKIAETHVRIEDGWRNCEFSHKGWIKETSTK